MSIIVVYPSNYIIYASNSNSNVITVGTGKQYSTLEAANAAVLPGQTIEIYNGNYNAIITSIAGTNTNPITIKAATGETPNITGIITNQGRIGQFHINHDNWIIGDGLNFTGDNNGDSTSWQNSSVERSIIIRANNVTLNNAKINKIKQEWILIPAGSWKVNGLRVSNANCSISGTLDDGTASHLDASDSFSRFNTDANNSNILIENSYFTKGGHSAGLLGGNNLTQINNVYNNDWSSVFGSNWGQKTFVNRANNSLIDNNIFMNPGRQYDNPSTLCYQLAGANMTMRRCFLLGNQTTTANATYSLDGLSIKTNAGSYNDNVYVSHCTIDNFPEMGLDIYDQDPSQTWGPFKFKNCIWSRCYGSPYSGFSFTAGIVYRYRSTRRPDWKTLLFIENCVFDQNYTVKILDLDGVVANVTSTITGMGSSYPANFKNNIIASPNYVSTVQSTSIDPATAIAETKANFTPQNVALIGKAIPLTYTSANFINQTNITVYEANWFRNNMGWSHLTGDDIYFDGIGTRKIVNIVGNVISLDNPISVANNVGIFLGDNDAPSIGANLNILPPAQKIVYSNGQLTNGGTHSTISAAISAAVPGDIIELRSVTAGTTSVWTESITFLNKNGSSTSPITLRVRAGDKVNVEVTSSSANSLNFVNSSYIKVVGPTDDITGLRLGNTAKFVHTGANTYRTCYPHKTSLYGENSDYITVQNIWCSGARRYEANYLDANNTNWLFQNVKASKHGTNAYDVNPNDLSNQDWGDLTMIQGDRHRLIGITGDHGGHNIWTIGSSNTVVREADCSGYWGDISPYPGSRAAVSVGVDEQVNNVPFTRQLWDNCIIRDSGASVDASSQALMKNQTIHTIMRNMFFFDAGGAIWHSNFTSDGNFGNRQSWQCFYNNTSYNSKGTWWNNNFSNGATIGNNNYELNLIINNVFQKVSDNDLNVTNPTNVVRYDTSVLGLNGYTNGFHGSIFNNNIFGGPVSQNVALLAPTGGNGAIFNVTSPPSTLQNNVLNNIVGNVTFVSLSTQFNRRKEGFVITAWPAGSAAGDAKPLANTIGSGSGNTSVVTVTNAKPFFDGWGVVGEVGDYVYIGTSAATATVSQISSIDYTNNKITLVSARSWGDDNGLWYGGNPYYGNPVLHDNRGANQ